MKKEDPKCSSSLKKEGQLNFLNKIIKWSIKFQKKLLKYNPFNKAIPFLLRHHYLLTTGNFEMHWSCCFCIYHWTKRIWKNIPNELDYRGI